MSDMTTIKVPKAVRDRLLEVAASNGLTLGQALDHLLGKVGARPKPTVGGYRSQRPLSAEEIDRELGQGFGA
ncbi:MULTISPECIES: hypothetical protein [unclassified Nocardia]|uniref:hypothetical protein n=1 Tax=unclassified Nocardia TaxID=2637762 RepID=UPI00129A3E28|nr:MULTISPECIES: hypothetical protein [unclassified Nocardia]WTL33222.1 hypothetical protein OHB26_02920 [Nocardia sp. NBC_01503]